MASKQDLDNWGELGNKGWSFDDMIPYYRKFERYHPASETLGKAVDDKYLDKSLRGTSGPVHVSFAKTIANAGYSPAKDPRTGSAIGGFNQLSTVDPEHNRRSYAAREYYEPNADRPNMTLVTHALVSKVELKQTAGQVKATGVEFTVDGTTHTMKAHKEVIVCGGTINSPQILELSGIGSPAVLDKAGVETIVDLPGVGENLNDHTATGFVLVSVHIITAIFQNTKFHQGVKDEYPTAEAFKDPAIMQQALEAYITHKAGPFAGPPGTTGFASLSKIEPDFPNAESHIQVSIRTPTLQVAMPCLRANSSIPRRQSANSLCYPLVSSHIVRMTPASYFLSKKKACGVQLAHAARVPYPVVPFTSTTPTQPHIPQSTQRISRILSILT